MTGEHGSMEVQAVPGLMRESLRDFWLDGQRVARVSSDGTSSEHDEATARRLALTWNLAMGMSTEDLEGWYEAKRVQRARPALTKGE